MKVYFFFWIHCIKENTCQFLGRNYEVCFSYMPSVSYADLESVLDLNDVIVSKFYLNFSFFFFFLVKSKGNMGLFFFFFIVTYFSLTGIVCLVILKWKEPSWMAQTVRI